MLGRDLEPIRISDVFAAEERIRKVFAPSPLVYMESLNQQLGAPVRLKAENLLPSGAYKYRGAANKITSLIEQNGGNIHIITASSGNHGMACALAARNLGVSATVVVPAPTPQIKKDSIRALGADLLETGETYDDSFESACRMAEEQQMFYVHPVADRFTVGGQGTIALEILDQYPEVEQVIVPIGGGGLITGIAFTLKTLRPSVKVIGVMPEGSAVYAESRRQGRLVALDRCASMADAVVRRTGEEYLFPYIEQYVDAIHTVSEETLKYAVKLGCLYGKLTLEGAAALPLAALLEKKCRFGPGTVLICSGGNIDQTMLDLCLRA